MRLRLFSLWAALCLASLSIPAAAHGASFNQLGYLPGGGNYESVAANISADGSVVVGYGSSASGGYEAFLWTNDRGMVGLGHLPGGYNSNATGVSADGSVIVGQSDSSSGQMQAFRWTSDGGMVSLGTLPGDTVSAASGISDDGSTIVGWSGSNSGVGQAFRWTSSEGMVGLGGIDSSAQAVSADGSVIVGTRRLSASTFAAFRWTSDGGMAGIGEPLIGDFYPNGISADGSTIVGTVSSAGQAFRWTSDGGFVRLGNLPGSINPSSSATDVSATGSVIVGTGATRFGGEATIWDATNGMRSIRHVLPPNVGGSLDGRALTVATAISADGLTVVGVGINAQGNSEAWVAYFGSEVPEPTTSLLLALGLFAGVLYRRLRRSC